MELHRFFRYAIEKMCKEKKSLNHFYSMKLFSNKVLLELCNIATKPVYHLMEYMYRYNMAFVSTFILPNYKNIGG